MSPRDPLARPSPTVWQQERARGPLSPAETADWFRSALWMLFVLAAVVGMLFVWSLTV